MKVRSLLLCAAFLFIGCSAYKQLQPKPYLLPTESGYIELKNGKNNFELKKEKKYFIQFPSAQENNFYLILSIRQKKSFHSFLTAELIDKKKHGELIKDESTIDTQSVYAVNPNGTGYFLLIDNVSSDVVLNVNYRYAPQWRFKFENKYEEFSSILLKNRFDRKNYNAIGNNYHLDGINYSSTIDSIHQCSSELLKVQNELQAIQNIFPKSIMNSKDQAYLNYVKLKDDLDEEISYQQNYANTISFFAKEFSSRNNPSEFIKAVDEFTHFFSQKDNYPSPVISEAQDVIKSRLTEVVPFFDQRISGKEDFKPFDDNIYMTSYLYRIRLLYEAAGLSIPTEYNSIVSYVKDFDAKALSLINAKDSMKHMTGVVSNSDQMPNDEFFKFAVKKAALLQNSLPSPIDESYGKYHFQKSARQLNDELNAFNFEIGKTLAAYREAEALVPQLNILKDQKDYSTMLGILKQNLHLYFLINKYKQLDNLSVDEQGNSIKSALNTNNWQLSESLLSKLHEDMNFLNPAGIYPAKRAVVESLEDSLYTRVDRASRIRITQFLDANVNTLENVDSLYSDTVFIPVYNITFTSGSRNELIQRKDKLIADLGKMRDDEFPARAIKQLYVQFTSNPSDNGVLKARAIVSHGKYYKANDKKIKLRISECDPYTAKWITKPKAYRRVFVLPVTNNIKGKNKYVVRFNVNIETEANFPVYDVNVKLPKEIARNAASSQWYETISLNKKPLKNEGRFSISAPSAENDFECQITPVQMNKDKNNILEIIFYDDSFKVFTFSTMVQKPIIKKN